MTTKFLQLVGLIRQELPTNPILLTCISYDLATNYPSIQINLNQIGPFQRFKSPLKINDIEIVVKEIPHHFTFYSVNAHDSKLLCVTPQQPTKISDYRMCYCQLAELQFEIDICFPLILITF